MQDLLVNTSMPSSFNGRNRTGAELRASFRYDPDKPTERSAPSLVPTRQQYAERAAQVKAVFTVEQLKELNH